MGRRRKAGAPALAVVQVAEVLNCSTAHVYELCEKGQLPHYRDAHNALRFECRALGEAIARMLTTH